MLQDPAAQPQYILTRLSPTRFAIARRTVRKGWWTCVATATSEYEAAALLDDLNRSKPNAEQA